MNKKKTKRIQAQASVILVDWLRSLLNEEEGLKINTKNYLNFMPTQTHFMAERTMYLNAYHPKWIKNKIKRLTGTSTSDFALAEVKTVSFVA